MTGTGRVAVVGASAYYSGPLLRLLKQEGYETVGLVRNSSATADVEPYIDKLCRGDLADQGFLQKSTEGCKAIINVVNQLNPPCKTIEDQLNNDMPALDSTLHAGLVNDAFVIHTSGNLSFPTKDREGAIKEDMPSVTYTPNAQGFPARWPNFDHIEELRSIPMALTEAKHRAAEYVLMWTQVHPRGRACVFYPSATYGPGVGLRGSDWISHFGRWINGTFQDFMTGFVHVEDVARCYVAMVERGQSGKRYLAAGQPMRTSEFFDLLAEEAGLTVPPGVSRYSNPAGLWYDDSRTRTELGLEWKYKVKDSISDLAAHLKTTSSLPL